MKKIFIQSLLKNYSIMVVAIIIFFASILSFLGWQQMYSTIYRTQQQIVKQLQEELLYYENVSRLSIYDIMKDSDKLDSAHQYLALSPSDYQSWLLHHPFSLVKKVSFYDNIFDLYKRYDFISGLDMALVADKHIFVSTVELKSGQKILATDYVASNNSFTVNIYHHATSQLMGFVYVSINTNKLTQTIQSMTTVPLSVGIKNSRGDNFYELNNGIDTIFDNQLTTDNMIINVSVPKYYVFHEFGKLLLFISVGSIILIIILLAMLQKIFLKYRRQVEDLVKTIQLISSENRNERIDVSSKEHEIHLIASEINRMLDSLDKSVNQIYALELAQKDANMKALQAQINPHFLYNTLEFFRMYAITQKVDDLADMIYKFSTLLRSSISQEKMTTIEEELNFCEQHSYICQIRYPKSIAYSFSIDKGCENIKIPRFTIQPLIENYFVHGIDLRRRNNAISVKVIKKDTAIDIYIRDNGKGMNEATVEKIKTIISKRHISKSDSIQTSIGISNVHERLLLHFGDNYDMHLCSGTHEGVMYIISLKNIMNKEAI